MRVLHVITGLGQGGAEGALFRLCSHADLPAGSTTVVSLMDDGFYGHKLRNAGVRVIALGMRSPLGAPLALWRLCRVVRQIEPELIQTWMYHADLVGGIAGRLTGVPVCWGIRKGNLELEKKRRTRAVARLCGMLSRALPVHAISCSECGIASHRAFGYRLPITVVPNGYRLERWRAALSTSYGRGDFRLDADDVVIAHAGRAHPQKDHASLATAFSTAFERNRKLRLMLCGEGLDAESSYFKSLPFSDEARSAVRALGPREDLPALWGLADFFVLSSVVEGFPNVVAEAMASHLPAVVTDVGDAARIVGSTGLVVPPSNPQALAEAMLRMADSTPVQRKALGAAAAARVEQNYTIESMVKGFRAVWRSLVPGGDVQ